MIKITPHVWLNESAIQFSFIASPGPGGQNVNKVATGVQLRLDITNSGLPEYVRLRLFSLFASRITKQDELIIKATRYRTQERNKHDALNRLIEILKQAAILPKKRRKTKPSLSSVEKGIKRKKIHSKKKKLRRQKLEE